jgi:hypothetical protein
MEEPTAKVPEPEYIDVPEPEPIIIDEQYYLTEPSTPPEYTKADDDTPLVQLHRVL